MFAFACAQGSRVARATTIELQNSNNDNENIIICVYIIKLLSWTHTGVDKAMPATLGISREKTHTRTHTCANISWSVYITCMRVCACAMQCVQSLIVQRAAAAAIKYYNDNNYNCLFIIIIIIYFSGASDMRFWIRQLSYHSTIYGFHEITYTRQTVSV